MRHEDVIGSTMYNHGPIILLDDVRKYRERRWQACVSIREDLDAGAFRPVNVSGGVDRLLDICTVKVEGRFLDLGEGSWET